MTIDTDKTLNIFYNPIIKDNKKPFDSDAVSDSDNLKKFASNIESLVSTEFEKQADGPLENSLIISIYGMYGFGKTTFVDMWGMQLVNKRNIALKFDAWKYDHTDEPALSFFSEINKQLGFYGLGSKVKKIIKQVAKVLPAVVRIASPIAKCYSAAHGIPIPAKTAENIIYKSLDKFNSREKTLGGFTKLLSKLVESLEGEFIYLFIDELDRCNPTFAVKLLEIIKHIFPVKGIVFILSLNRQALESTFGKVYGFNEDQAKEYLERFFDFQLKLPTPNIKSYAKILLETHLECVNGNISFYLNSKPQSLNIKDIALSVFQECCDENGFNFSLRDTEKLTREIIFFLDVNSKDKSKSCIDNIFIPIALYLFCLKRNDTEQYEKLCSELTLTGVELSGLATPTIEIFYYTFDVFLKSSCKGKLSEFLARGDNQRQIKGLESYFCKLYGGSSNILIGEKRDLSHYKPTLNDLEKKLNFIHETTA